MSHICDLFDHYELNQCVSSKCLALENAFPHDTQVWSRHRNFSRETGKREICRREISHGKIRREKREIVKSNVWGFFTID